MAKSIHISTPTTAPHPPRFFAVAGVGKEGVVDIKFTLMNAAGKPVKIVQSHIHRALWPDLKTGPNVNWIIIFEGVETGKNHKLHIEDAADPTVTDDRTLDVSDTKALTVQWPVNDDTIPADNFAPYGTTNEMLPMYAVLGVPGASAMNGWLVQGPPNSENWVFQFSQLPTGSGASLQVILYGGSSQTVSNLTVQ